MNKAMIEKVNEVLASNDEQKIKEFSHSEEFKQVRDEFLKVWNEIKTAFRGYVDQIIPIFRQLIEVKKESDHYIRYSSYTKKKSQRKNWKKWRKK